MAASNNRCNVGKSCSNLARVSVFNSSLLLGWEVAMEMVRGGVEEPDSVSGMEESASRLKVTDAGMVLEE